MGEVSKNCFIMKGMKPMDPKTLLSPLRKDYTTFQKIRQTLPSPHQKTFI